jgi:deoxyribodipyrimidine photolyase-related protein
MKAILILGNQLFEPSLIKAEVSDAKKTIVFMREDLELCKHFRYHKQKIIFFLAAMRTYAKEIEKNGFQVHYEKLNPKQSENFETSFTAFLKKNRINELYFFEIEDKFFEKRIQECVGKQVANVNILQSPMFLTKRSDFADYLKKSKRPFMRTFYEAQRKRLNILIDKKKEPIGGQWSFDQENREKLPLDLAPPPPKKIKASSEVLEVIKLINHVFPDHPGRGEDFWLPVDRKGAHEWLEQFLTERLENFGPYEDALALHSDFVFHSALTPFLNTGLLTPSNVIEQTISHATHAKIPLPSLEGFIRQIIGWREFVRGIYQNYSEVQDTKNYWQHKRKLSQLWYDGNTGIPPLDATLSKVIKYSYAHHIERLMVLGSLMLLLEIDPGEAHRWFMEMFMDSSEWVMGPNVYGMALFSDGGIFATKPYICGSNYYRKMGPFKKDSWCEGVDGLYWAFIDKHKDFFLKNPRLSMMARTLEKMDGARKKHIFIEADKLRARLTTT